MLQKVIFKNSLSKKSECSVKIINYCKIYPNFVKNLNEKYFMYIREII
jgi:hypothetical protein